MTPFKASTSRLAKPRSGNFVDFRARGRPSRYLLLGTKWGMSLILWMFDGEGTEIGWFRAIHDEAAVPDVDWQEPYVYEWALTHPEPDMWEMLESSLRFYTDPAKIGRTETVESEKLTLDWERFVRLDDDGPEAYLRDVASAVERKGVPQTEIEAE